MAPIHHRHYRALASVRQHPDVDPQRLGMWGHSLGGFITVRAMVTGDIKAGVIWAGNRCLVPRHPGTLAQPSPARHRTAAEARR